MKKARMILQNGVYLDCGKEGGNILLFMKKSWKKKILVEEVE